MEDQVKKLDPRLEKAFQEKCARSRERMIQGYMMKAGMSREEAEKRVDSLPI